VPEITVFPDTESFIAGAADFIAGLAGQAVTERGRFSIALAGGNTPGPVYERLALSHYAERIDWPWVQVFFGDERCVPPDDSRSNHRMAREALFDHVPLPPGNVHRIRGEDDPRQAALLYELELQAAFRTTRPPAFDLILLGMGGNGHTASLFPGSAALRETAHWAVAQYVEVMQSWRVTLTVPLINAARHVAFLVQGEEKAEVLWRVFEGPYQPDVLPAQLIGPAQGRLTCILDAPAAARLKEQL
jgi:6-phosphogluconolactonase